MSISEFKKMFKKKCDDEEDWTPYRRELICNAIHWHKNPNYSKICWKEYAYNLIEEAEDEMLAGTFDEWIRTKQISPKQRWKTRPLEAWGSTIPKRIADDKRNDEEKVGKLRTHRIREWCMVSCLHISKMTTFTDVISQRLPRPIPEKTLRQLGAYGTYIGSNGYPTKSEFIRQLPKLLREFDIYEEKERKKKELRALHRIRQDSVLDRICSDIIQQVVEGGPLSAASWCTILQGALQQVGKTSIESKIPHGTLAVIKTEDWKSDWDGKHLMRLIDLLENKLCPHPGTSANEELLHPASYEFFNTGEDRVFVCPAAALLTGSTCHESCKRKDMMNFRELISHLLSAHPRNHGYRCLWTTPQESIVVHPAVKKTPSLTLIGGKQYRQKVLQQWFRPLPEMKGTECTGGWMRCSGVFRALLRKRRISGNPIIAENSGNGMLVVGNPTVDIHGITKNVELKSNKGEANLKPITTYFHRRLATEL